MNKVCIATLTHNLGQRHICLHNTVTSLLDNTRIPFIIDWYIHSNGITQEIVDVVTALQQKYKDKANIIFSHSDTNMGVGIGINTLNSFIKEYEYTLFVEGDWITLPEHMSGHNDWFMSSLQFLQNRPDAVQILFRRYLNDGEDRFHRFHEAITPENIKYILETENKFAELVAKDYTNNPHLRRNASFYEAKIFPLKEFYDQNKNPTELKGNPDWGMAEIDAEVRGRKLRSYYLYLGNMVHADEAWTFGLDWEKIQQSVNDCNAHSAIGMTKCKYGFADPNPKFCAMCDHSKPFTDQHNHQLRFIEKYFYNINVPMQKVKLHILTRCSRINNLQKVKESIFTGSNFDIVWHVIFDTGRLKDIDAETLCELESLGAQLHFAKNRADYLHLAINDVVETLEDGFVSIMDDDNLVHPDFFETLYTEIIKNPNKKAFIFEQYVGGQDFTGLEVRPVGVEHMKLRHIDSAQYVIHHTLHKMEKYTAEYYGDGIFLENVYKVSPDDFHFIHRVLCYYNKLSSPSKARVPKVLYIGEAEPHLESINYLGYEDTSLNVLYRKNDSDILKDIVEFNPDSIITVSNNFLDYPNLCNTNLEVRKKWVHLTPDREQVGEIAYTVATNQMLTQGNDHLISYFTPIYNTGDKLWNTYESLKKQTYPNWEWVMVNDSTDGGKTLKIAEQIAKQDYRVKVYDFREKSKGIIGESKYRAACLTRGKWLAELDHDDILVEECSQYIVDASKTYPDAGFIYTDSVEATEDWHSLTYVPGFALGYGKYYKTNYKGHEWDVAVTCNINPKTIRHIVGVPNHVRVWRRDVYFAVGGHNRDLSVADDYELIVRTFLHTKFVKIPKLGYIQFIYNNPNGQNTHNLSRADIQRRVRSIMYFYNDAIYKRFTELGVEDYPYLLNKDNPLAVPSRFGSEEGYVNYIYTL